MPHAAVGFWQRSERCFAMGFAIGLGHVETGLLVVGTLPVLTVLRRWRQVMAVAEGRREPEPPARIRPFAIWRHPRGSLGYDAIAIAVLAFIALAPVAWPWLESGDALRNALVRLVGAAGG